VKERTVRVRVRGCVRAACAFACVVLWYVFCTCILVELYHGRSVGVGGGHAVAHPKQVMPRAPKPPAYGGSRLCICSGLGRTCVLKIYVCKHVCICIHGQLVCLCVCAQKTKRHIIEREILWQSLNQKDRRQSPRTSLETPSSLEKPSNILPHLCPQP
jgi:hypothetical protein